MKCYLSSYKLGNEVNKFRPLMPKGNNKIGYIPNALDFTSADPKRRKESIRKEIEVLRKLDLDVKLLDLKMYFGKKNKLKNELDKLGGIFIRGGNTFVLRQAMRISKFDELFEGLRHRKDFLYSGYSAGICVLAPNLKGLQIVDDATDFPYREIKETIWKGLNYLDYLILPHYKSDHPESENIDKEVEYCKKNNIKFKTLKDGEVIII